jgi:tetratricopeptide (TPR) repeat protein
MAAYNAYLRGRQLQARRTSADLEQALAEFTRATELDPEYALAWVGVAEAASLLTGYGTLPIPESLKIQESAVNNALAIDNELGEVYTSLAGIYSFKDMDEEADAAYRRAIELSPNYASAYHWYSGFLRDYIERIDEAVVMLEKAAELDPMSSIIQSSLANLQDQMGRYDDAEAQYLRVIELDPDFPPNYANLAFFYGDSRGQLAQAVKTIQIAREKDPGNIGLLQGAAILRLNLGDYEAVKHLSEQAQEIDSEHFTVGVIDLLLNVSQGNYSGALEVAQWITPKVAGISDFLEFVSIVHTLNGDWKRARELMLQAFPSYGSSDSWAVQIEDSMDIACRMAEIYIRTNDEAMGEKLIDDVLTYHARVKTLIEDQDRIAPAACWVLRGDYDLALGAVESWVAAKQHSFWWLVYKLPVFDTIRAEPRFQAAMQAIEADVAEQRQLLAEMNLETGA